MARCTDTFILRISGTVVSCSLTIAADDKILPSSSTHYGHGAEDYTVNFTYTRGNDADTGGITGPRFLLDWGDNDWGLAASPPTGITVSGAISPPTPDVSGSATEVKSGTVMGRITVSEDVPGSTTYRPQITVIFDNGTDVLELDPINDQTNTVNQAITPIEPTFSGGAAPYLWRITNRLPTGLSINENTGEISGTPTTIENLPLISIQVRDGFKNIVTRVFDWDITA